MNVPGKKKANTADETHEDKETHTPSLPAGERYRGNAVTLPVTPASVTPPPPPSDWGFAEWWAYWETTLRRLFGDDYDVKLGSRDTALAAWVKRGWALNPAYPKARLGRFAGTKEWKDRGCSCSPAKFLGDDRYTPPARAAWKPAPIIDELDADEWAAALLDVTAELQRRELLTPARHAVIDRAMEDRGVVKADRFWHDLVVESPSARMRQLHGPRTGGAA